MIDLSAVLAEGIRLQYEVNEKRSIEKNKVGNNGRGVLPMNSVRVSMRRGPSSVNVIRRK